MPALHRNRVQMTVTGTPGTGTITLNAASSGYQSFAAAYGGNATVDVLITDGTAWEVARNCTYTHSGTTLTRGTLEASSTGSAISLTSAAVVSVIFSAAAGNAVEGALQAVTPGGRLTLTSGTPVTTSDVTGATTIYYTPYVHNIINLWDGADWIPTTFAETSHALGTVTSGANYDVFGYLSGGALALEKLVWTNDTTRATDVTLQDGRYCKSGDKTRLYLGTFRSTSTTTTEDSGARSTTAARKRFVWNAHNRLRREVCIEEDTSSWTFGTNGAWHRVASASDNQVEFVCGIEGESLIYLDLNLSLAVNQTSSYVAAGIGLDSTSAIATVGHSSFYSSAHTASSGVVYAAHAVLARRMPLGYHYAAALETFGGTATLLTGYGTNSVARTPSLLGWVEA